MIYYQCRKSQIKYKNYRVVYREAWSEYVAIKSRSKRKPYVRSNYFDKDKIFFDHFWPHLKQKNKSDRSRRLSVFPCAIELAVNSHLQPESIVNPGDKGWILYKFAGYSRDGVKFFVHIKENKKTGTKFLMSCFPEK